MSILRPLLRRVPKPFRNRYVLVGCLFAAWILLFDRHDFYTQWKLRQTINKLCEDRQYYLREIDQIQADRRDLEADKEKFAREHFYMRKSNEEVFVIKKKD